MREETEAIVVIAILASPFIYIIGLFIYKIFRKE